MEEREITGIAGLLEPVEEEVSPRTLHMERKESIGDAFNQVSEGIESLRLYTGLSLENEVRLMNIHESLSEDVEETIGQVSFVLQQLRIAEQCFSRVSRGLNSVYGYNTDFD